MKKRNIILVVILSIVLLSTVVNAQSGLANIYRDGYAEGFFKEYKNNTVFIESYEGDINRIPFNSNAEILIDGRPVKFSDFRSGMEVFIEMRGRQGIYMDAFSASNPGYISPGTKSVTGVVKMIDRNQIKIALPIGGEKTYFLSPATIVRRDKQNVTANQLYLGDSVKLTFNDANSSMISKMDIEGQSILIKDIYRGKVSTVDQLTDNMNFESIEVIRNGNWEQSKDGLRISFNGDIPVYIAGQEIPRENLKYYKGKTAYLAIKDEFGRDNVEKMVFKNQYENSYSTKIESIGFGGDEMELSTKQNIRINEGTMIIKSGRLVDINSLNPKSDALIITDGKGMDQTAGLIYIYNEDLNNSNIGQDHFYAGRMDKIVRDRLTLRDFFLLDGNEWESFADDKELFYDDDTFIYNLDTGEEVSPKTFFSKEYSFDENNKNREDRDHYAYIYTDGDRASTIFIKKKMDSLLKQRAFNGVVASKTADTISLKDSKGWSSAQSQWIAQSANTNIFLGEAMIMKNGERIQREDIQVGDRIYAIKDMDNNRGKLVIIK